MCCLVAECVKNSTGALLVELGATSYSKLGVSLTSFPSFNSTNVVLIDAIRPASVADRLEQNSTTPQAGPPSYPPSQKLL